MPPLSHYIWYEKYRPDALNQLILSDEYKQRFNNYIEERNIPHLLFIGPPGSGKTTLAMILTNNIPSQVLTLNASSGDRGVDTVKGKIKQFASAQSLHNTLKVVFLDEADGLTVEAQRALRNTMEMYSDTCRFILTANYGDKIEGAIKSRCTPFTFETISKATLIEDLAWMLEEEHVQYTDDDLADLVDRYYPDVRTIINNLQAGSINGVFNPALAGTAMNIDLNVLAQHLQQGNITSARQLWAGNSDFVWLYRWLFDDWVATQFLDESRTVAALVVAQYLYQDSTVLDREINFTACCLDIMKEGGINIKWR